MPDESLRRLVSTVLFAEYGDAQKALGIVLQRGGEEAWSLAERMRRIDGLRPDALTNYKIRDAVPQARYELGLFWYPTNIPIMARFFLDGQPLAADAYEGGRVFLPLAARTGKLLYTIRFLQSGWKYQLWRRFENDPVKLKQGNDPDDASDTDNRIVEEVDL
jgi:hypothetical protein